MYKGGATCIGILLLCPVLVLRCLGRLSVFAMPAMLSAAKTKLLSLSELLKSYKKGEDGHEKKKLIPQSGQKGSSLVLPECLWHWNEIHNKRILTL